MTLPAFLADAMLLAHPGWHETLERALFAMQKADSGYLEALGRDRFLPTRNRMFAAFSLPMPDVRYVLAGEGPYPREESASGYCFMDAAVSAIWSEKGFSKQVNRATSLRNFLKMLLVAEKALKPDSTGAEAMLAVAGQGMAKGSPYIGQLAELQAAMLGKGFLLLNATPVFRAHVPPAKESRAWQPFLAEVLASLAAFARKTASPLPALILWGKIAEKLAEMPEASVFPQIRSEHPYNLSFIKNETMQEIFAPMRLMRK